MNLSLFWNSFLNLILVSNNLCVKLYVIVTMQIVKIKVQNEILIRTYHWWIWQITERPVLHQKFLWWQQISGSSGLVQGIQILSSQQSTLLYMHCHYTGYRDISCYRCGFYGSLCLNEVFLDFISVIFLVQPLALNLVVIVSNYLEQEVFLPYKWGNIHIWKIYLHKWR